MSKKKETKNTRQIAKSHELSIINNLRPIITSLKNYGLFFIRKGLLC